MSNDANHGPLWVIAVKSIVFTLITGVATGLLALTIRNSSSGDLHTYTAIFTDVTSLNRGDDVRAAGVKVGTVEDIQITDKRLARVKFTIRDGVPAASDSVLQIKFRNLVGQRYIALQQPDPSGSDATPVSASARVEPGHVFGVEQTRPALDLTVLFNGFRPLMRLLDPEDVNNLSEQIIAVFQGEDATVEGLMQSTASLTTALAEKDQVIGELITGLSSVLTDINSRSGQLDTTLVTMQQLVTGLSEDRQAIGASLEGMGALTTRVSTLVGETRPALRRSIRHLGVLAQTLDTNSDDVENFLRTTPIKLDRIARTASYGSWLNFYLCSMDGRIPMAEGYMGDVGVLPVAGRCR
ncbi:MCE family protein [Nocardioides marmoriginsengisoli]|uniref:MCE family protein n=1 Tax=Nocardioides marmoriginsengisoli TaxID=661483 RepID=A0A3N0CG40_9ACTN|nr:MlaD family protein [Nocardioides marmoriginsengisoli]RNL62424.1 MCE family protein [Nocardioides marmoriginsengisoli]